MRVNSFSYLLAICFSFWGFYFIFFAFQFVFLSPKSSNVLEALMLLEDKGRAVC